MDIITIDSTLSLILLDQKPTGFTSFIGSWLYQGDQTVLVDPGPSATIPKLIEALKHLGVKRPDVILLTHIHIDHAGGAGDLSAYCPDTPVVCHGSGIKHMKDPSRLWEGSLKTLGETAQAYGPIRPVPADLLLDAALYNDYNIMPVMTPGHAPHHVSYLKDGYLFAGEAGGVFTELSDQNHYLRPATPPRFFLETTIQSLDRLIDIPHETACFGHFGVSRRTPRLFYDHKEQLYLWHDLIRQETAIGPDSNLIDRCLKRLISDDPQMASWSRLDRDVQKREIFFLENSIRGYVGYIREKETQ